VCSLILFAHLFDILLYLRLSDTQLLPTPLGFDVCSHLTRKYSSRILQSANSALLFIYDQRAFPLRHLPTFTFTLVVLAYKAMSQSRKVSQVEPPPQRRSRQSSESEESSARCQRMYEDSDQIRTRLIVAHRQYTPLLAAIDGSDAPTVWARALRDLQQQHSEEIGQVGEAIWDEWMNLGFDYDAIFGSQAGFDIGWIGGLAEIPGIGQ
jgi:hypothetical protein